MTVGRTFGRMWRAISARAGAPRARAAPTYSVSLSDRTEQRTIRVTGGGPRMPTGGAGAVPRAPPGPPRRRGSGAGAGAPPGAGAGARPRAGLFTAGMEAAPGIGTALP